MYSLSAIGATGFMEDDFMSELTPAVKKMFRAKRYMDDILILYVENENWDHERFLADFERSECYHPPPTIGVGGRSAGDVPGDDVRMERRPMGISD